MKFPKINLQDVSGVLKRESSETESEQIPESQTDNMSNMEKVKCHAIIQRWIWSFWLDEQHSIRRGSILNNENSINDSSSAR